MSPYLEGSSFFWRERKRWRYWVLPSRLLSSPTFRARQFASFALRLASNRAIKEQFNLSIQRAVLPRKRAENYAD
jgi:hypothetical protein